MMVSVWVAVKVPLGCGRVMEIVMVNVPEAQIGTK